jgi:hypothetical protein
MQQKSLAIAKSLITIQPMLRCNMSIKGDAGLADK